MDQLQQFLDGSSPAAPVYNVETTLLTMLLAFSLGQLVAWVYSWTHAGVSYSKTFTQSLVLMAMVVSLVMLVIGDSIVTAFGLLGALAIVRFRNVLKDTRDTVFVFLVLVIGMAVGSQRYQAAIVGTLGMLAVVFYLYITSFGSRGHFDGHLTCWVARGPNDGPSYSDIVHRFCRRAKQMSCREGGAEGLTEYVFQVNLRDRTRHAEMVESLRTLPSMGEVSFVMRDQLAEL